MIVIIYNAPEGLITHPAAAQEFSEKLALLMFNYGKKNPSDENFEVEGGEADLPAGYIIVLRKKAKGSQVMNKAESDLVEAIALLLGEILSKYASGEYEIEFVTQFH
jgi:hypothetical protein